MNKLKGYIGLATLVFTLSGCNAVDIREATNKFVRSANDLNGNKISDTLENDIESGTFPEVAQYDIVYDPDAKG